MNEPFQHFGITNTSGTLNDSTVTRGIANTLDFSLIGAKKSFKITPSATPSAQSPGFAIGIGAFFTDTGISNGVTLNGVSGSDWSATWSAQYFATAGQFVIIPSSTCSIATGSDVKIVLGAITPTVQPTSSAGIWIALNQPSGFPYRMSETFVVNGPSSQSDRLLDGLAPTAQASNVYVAKVGAISSSNTTPSALSCLLTAQTSLQAGPGCAITVNIPVGSPSASGSGLIAAQNEIGGLLLQVSGTALTSHTVANTSSTSALVSYKIALSETTSIATDSTIELSLPQFQSCYSPGSAFMTLLLDGFTNYQPACWNMPVQKCFASMSFVQTIRALQSWVPGGYTTSSGQTVQLTWDVVNATQIELVGSGFQTLNAQGALVTPNHSTSYVLVAYDQTTGNVASSGVTVTTKPNWQTEAFPLNAIVAWNGLISDLPAGWVPCDGQHGSAPDLQNLFIIGSGVLSFGGSISELATGTTNTQGRVTHDHGVHFAVGGTVISAGRHGHGNNFVTQGVCTGENVTNTIFNSGNATATLVQTGTHSHVIDQNVDAVSEGVIVTTGAAVPHPPYYALFYAMYVGESA